MTPLLTDLIALSRTANDQLAAITLDPALDFYTQGLDSLDHMQILMAVEEAFGLQIADQDFDRLTTLSQIAGFLIAAGVATGSDQRA